MRLHENWELFSDALQAASRPIDEDGLGIKSIFIEKDYWICRSLALMSANDKDNRAIFKGGTSLTKAYGIGSRFSEDIDVTPVRDNREPYTIIMLRVYASSPRHLA